LAGDHAGVAGVVVGEAAGEFAAGGVDERDEFSLGEIPFDGGNPRGEERAAGLVDRTAGAVVENEFSLRRDRVADPALPGGEGDPLWKEEGADLFAGEDVVEDVGAGAVGDDHVSADGGRGADRGELALHAAGAAA